MPGSVAPVSLQHKTQVLKKKKKKVLVVHLKFNVNGVFCIFSGNLDLSSRPFYRQGSAGSERLRDVPKALQPGMSRERMRARP